MIHTRIVICLKNVFGTGPILEPMTFLTGALMYPGITIKFRPTFVGLITFWNQSYIGIARANSAFAVITKAKADGVVDAALANRLRGEAYFLRGMTYYYLAASFGGVPLELELQDLIWFKATDSPGILFLHR